MCLLQVLWRWQLFPTIALTNIRWSTQISMKPLFYLPLIQLFIVMKINLSSINKRQSLPWEDNYALVNYQHWSYITSRSILLNVVKAMITGHEYSIYRHTDRHSWQPLYSSVDLLWYVALLTVSDLLHAAIDLTYY